MQFKSLGKQIEFYLDPNHLDLWELQKSFNTLINRYYHVKLTSRTLFKLQPLIDEIEGICEILQLIKRKKVEKRLEGINKLCAKLNHSLIYNYIERLGHTKSVNNIQTLVNVMSEDNNWCGLAYHLQIIFKTYFDECKLNYEFQKIIKTSTSGMSEMWKFIKGNIAVLTILGGICYSLLMLITKYVLISELKDKRLINLLGGINLDLQIELLKVLFLPLILFLLAGGIYVNFILLDADLILDKSKIKKVKNQSEASKYLGWKLLVLFLILIIYSAQAYILFSNKIATNIKFIVFLIFFAILAVIIIRRIYKSNTNSNFDEILKNLVVVLLTSSLPLILSFVFIRSNGNYGLLMPLYLLIVECVLIMLYLFMFIDIKVQNMVGKLMINVGIYLTVSFGIIWQSMDYLEFLGLRNNPNLVSLLEVKMNKSDLTEQLQDMGFPQLKYEGNESQARDLLLESYVFTQGIESEVHLAESKVALTSLTQYIEDNKNIICNSKLNRAILSEFENDGESWYYFDYDGCNANINSFKFDQKIKLVNKLFLVRKSESDYTYWIFGAHVNWKKPDELIISAAKNDDVNTIRLNKDRGMLFYNETPFSIFKEPDNLRDFKLTKYANELNAIY